jgi:hypothetical protein
MDVERLVGQSPSLRTLAGIKGLTRTDLPERRSGRVRIADHALAISKHYGATGGLLLRSLPGINSAAQSHASSVDASKWLALEDSQDNSGNSARKSVLPVPGRFSSLPLRRT